MASFISAARQAGSPQPDALDRLLDYDNAVEDLLRDIPRDNENAQRTASPAAPPRAEDQEVQVKRQRNPIPKLDENRLLSEAGIPKLRKITKTRLKFKGKGHEFRDISTLLHTYQLWLDDLYPRAKFRDALTMVEKAGHSKRLQVMRRAWLDETKPHRRDLTPDVELSPAGWNDNGTARPGGDNSLLGTGSNDKPEEPDVDELDALLAEDQEDDTRQSGKPQQRRQGPFEDDDDDEDELDALIAEQSSNTMKAKSLDIARTEDSQDNPNEDELDALMAEQTSIQDRSANTKLASASHTDTPVYEHGYDFADEEEVMADMNGTW